MTISMKEFLEKHNVQEGELVVFSCIGASCTLGRCTRENIFSFTFNYSLELNQTEPIALLRFPNGRKLTDVCEQLIPRHVWKDRLSDFFSNMEIIYAEQEPEAKEKTAEEKLEERVLNIENRLDSLIENYVLVKKCLKRHY